MSNLKWLPDVPEEEWPIIKEGDLVSLCGKYTKIMDDPRHGSAGMFPYINPGPGPGVVISVIEFPAKGGIPCSEIMWPNGSVSKVENAFLKKVSKEESLCMP